MSYCLSRPNVDGVGKRWASRAREGLRWTGVVSYSIYLIHQPFLYAIPPVLTFILHGHAVPELAMYALCLGAWFPIFGMAYLFYRYVEQPSIAWGKRIIEQRRQAAQRPAPEPA
jgi:peptidoglycan/LPS O-acetylase OafA/YrhL